MKYNTKGDEEDVFECDWRRGQQRCKGKHKAGGGQHHKEGEVSVKIDWRLRLDFLAQSVEAIKSQRERERESCKEEVI